MALCVQFRLPQTRQPLIWMGSVRKLRVGWTGLECMSWSKQIPDGIIIVCRQWDHRWRRGRQQDKLCTSRHTSASGWSLVVTRTKMVWLETILRIRGRKGGPFTSEAGYHFRKGSRKPRNDVRNPIIRRIKLPLGPERGQWVQLLAMPAMPERGWHRDDDPGETAGSWMA